MTGEASSLTKAPADAMSVALAVSDAALMQRLTELLQEPDVVVTQTARSIGALVAAPAAVDAAVLDERGRRTSEIRTDVLRAKRALGTARLILICSTRRGPLARVTVQVGADGVLVERHLETALLPALRATRAHLVVISAPLLRGAIHAGALTYRERQILGMVVMGFTNQQISQKLCLAESTVKGHLSSAFAKLDVSSRNEAASLILDPHQGIGAGILGISGPNGAG